jgi:uncharacterized protein YhbP (UPF0306 family)
MGKKSDLLTAQVREFLRAHNVAALATCSGEEPWAAAVFYVSDWPALFFLSSPTSRHSLNLAANPRVALTVQDDCADWQGIRGIQIEGVVVKISGEEEEQARRLYGEKFPVIGLLAKAPTAIVKALARVHWYKILPRRIYFIDNSQGLGHRDELDPTGAGKG